MGKPSSTGVDQANQVVTGSFTNTGTSTPVPIYGAFNLIIWGSSTVTLTTTNGNTTASISTNSGLAAGGGISSTNLPQGTTIGAVSTNTLNLAFPPGFTNGNVTTGVDANASFAPTAWNGLMSLERSFDGGQTFFTCGVGGGGSGAIYTGSTQVNTPVSIAASEPERGVFYRFNCSSYTSGTINYRLSASGLAAMAWGIPL